METPINSPTYPTYYLDHFSFFTFGCWSSEALIHYSIILLSVLLSVLWALCLYFGLHPGVTYICLLGFFSTINNLLFHQWSLCVCVINQKEFILLIIKKKKSSLWALSLLWSSSWSNLHLFSGFLSPQSTICSFISGLFVFVLSIKKSSFSWLSKEKKSSLSFSTTDLKIVNQWSISTSKNYQISFWSLFFFVFFYFFFISSRSDHNFIPVYPKFIGKAEVERNRSNLKNRSRFSEPYCPITVRTACCFFPLAVPEAKINRKTERCKVFSIEPFGVVWISKP